MEELLLEAETLIGRRVEVMKLPDGKFIVLWMNFQSPPPPTAETPEEALRLFIEKVKNTKEENTDERSNSELN